MESIPTPQHSSFTRMIIFLLKVALMVIVVFGVMLFFAQNSMIYHGAAYEPGEVETYVKHSGVVSLEFSTEQGRQEAYWITRGASPDSPPKLPDRVWLVFGGNAAQALGWVDFLTLYRGEYAGFLLIDYPGYGSCEGAPSPDSILQSTLGAVEALTLHLKCSEREDLQPRLAVLGQSLGAAAGLQAAVHYQVNRIVLISPFTTMLDMARRTAGPLHCHVLRHRWNNVARLKELTKISPLPQVSILHGNADNIVPITMGRSLSEQFRCFTDFTELTGFGHNDITYGAAESILDALSR
ncbi:MAG: hypothetical protein ACI9R3_001426 [Verrucomicrobiales bacterium]|jgi:hypothetical protein